ncbi:helix-turn-helix domain-containing protein [Blastococcus saxobsidens]|uniref:Excisionase family DNA binding protein n=1 Tax=Blastococcus saxobsidens TaxID=138336 RepID=A0A4Q7Y6C6_9ACTN|nr:helix-turn-helix domain-containing protein [Blastococcus saxobsidens]RZU32512.1 excisionase family DNA binding protein [Blastococcus saxobsidens]
MPLLTTQQAAERIGVSVRHVQRLVAGGGLDAIGTDRIDADSVAQWLAQRQGRRLRAWEAPTAWAAVALLEDEPAPWLGQAQRSRLRSALAGTTAAELTGRTRNRAEVQRFHAHPRALGHLTRDVVESGANRGIGGLAAASDRLDGYIAASGVRRVVQRYELDPDPAGNLTLRTTDMPLDVVAELVDGRRHVLAGLDLAGSTDTRERSAGHRLLDRALAALKS